MIKIARKDKVVVDLEVLRKSKVAEVLSHRYDKQLYFTYDGHVQRWETYDIVRMSDCEMALEKKVMPAVEWKYDDGYVTATSASYFFMMKMTGYAWEQKLREAEKVIVDLINECTTVEELDVDFISQFDNLLAV